MNGSVTPHRAQTHKRIQSRLCGDFPRINLVNPFMRRRATHKVKIAIMRPNGAFLPHKVVEHFLHIS